MAELVIRQMEEADIDQVIDVEMKTFAAPWTRDIFLQEIGQNQFAHYFVVLIDKYIVGYAGMWIVADEVQITNIAILPAYHGNRLGQKLFHYILCQALRLGGCHLSLEVRSSNIVAQRLYRKFGLVPGGIRKNYYTDNQEDAIVMWVNLNEQG